MKCFVIMPFGNPALDAGHARRLELIYSEWIKPTVESIKYDAESCIACHRADKERRPEEIVNHIIENLISSDLVIADLSGRNANVFYELGVRHAVNNNTILIADNLADVPFDLRGLRTIIYTYEPEQMNRLKRSLEQAIGEILREPEKIDNPVRRFLYNREVDKLIKQTTPPGYDVFKDIIAEVGSLRNEVSNHLSEVRQVMQLMTSKESVASTVGLAQKLTLEFFEGCWTSGPVGSAYYARVIDGELFMPYCYGGDSHLTGHYYNLRVVGEALVGRFEWFNSRITGYALNKVVSANQLDGAWWYAEDIPKRVLREAVLDVSRINLSLPRKNDITFHRSIATKQFPKWAEDYFRDRLYKRE